MCTESAEKNSFKHKDIKTKKYIVDVEFDSYKARDLLGKRFAGFKCHHSMKIEFPADGMKLSRILALLTICPV